MTQCERIVQYIEAHGAITQEDAYRDLGIARLASRFNDLKRQGVPIISEMRAGRNRYGEKTHYSVYSLKEKKEA